MLVNMVNMVSSRYTLFLFTYVWVNSGEECCARRPQDTDDEEAITKATYVSGHLDYAWKLILTW